MWLQRDNRGITYAELILRIFSKKKTAQNLSLDYVHT